MEAWGLYACRRTWWTPSARPGRLDHDWTAPSAASVASAKSSRSTDQVAAEALEKAERVELQRVLVDRVTEQGGRSLVA